MKSLLLYGTTNCHLCEQALEMLESLSEQYGVKVTFIDIVDDDHLFEQYQLTIPVVKNPITQGTCLWPFDGKDLEQLIKL